MSLSPFHHSPSGSTRKKVALDMVTVRKIQPGKQSSPVMDVTPPRLAHRKSEKTGVKNSMQVFFLACFRMWHVLALVARRVFYRGRRYLKQAADFLKNITADTAPRKMVYLSIVVGIAFGMVSMAFISHSFGAGVFARSQSPVIEDKTETVAPVATPNTLVDMSYDPQQDVFFEYFNEITEEQYENNIRAMVKDYPIEPMLPYIFAQDRLTAAFLVGIAKKESNWGKRIPVLDDQDCFNYWGYRGVRRMMGTGGHTCFNSRKDAVETVAKRIKNLVSSEKLDTPEKMIVWKCGYSCQGHSRESVKKWISDVDMYFSQLNAE